MLARKFHSTELKMKGLQENQMQDCRQLTDTTHLLLDGSVPRTQKEHQYRGHLLSLPQDKETQARTAIKGLPTFLNGSGSSGVPRYLW